MDTDTKKIFKDVLKNEISPLLIGLRNEIEQLGKTYEAARQASAVSLNLSPTAIESMKHHDGKTPVKYVDYFTDKEANEFLSRATPRKGIDYFNESDIAAFKAAVTPKKGTDYHDGRTPIKGTDYFTEAEIKDFLSRATPKKGIHYHDGAPGQPGEKGADGTKISAEDIRRKLESLKGTARLSIKAVKGWEDAISDFLLKKGFGHTAAPQDGGIGGSGSGGAASNITGLISAGTNVTITGSGTSSDPYVINASGGGGGSQTPWASNINAAGFTLHGNSTSGGTLTISSTSNATKGSILFGTQASFDEVNGRFIVGTATGAGRLNLPDAGTTVADGITWGNNDTAIFRSSANTLRVQGAATTRYLDISVGSTSTTITAKGSAGDALALRGGVSGNNALLTLGTSSQVATLARNIADANAVFTVTQTHASATGDIQDWANSGGNVVSILQNGSLALTPSSLTGSSATSPFDLAQTWNTTGSPTAIKVNITNTASGASARLIDLQIGGVSFFNVSKTGVVTTKGDIVKRVTTITSSATPTVNTDDCDCVNITALATNITSMTTNLSGTPTDFKTLVYRIKDDGTPRTISWGASFVSRGVTLPTTTVAGKLLTVGFMWNAAASDWDCIASAQEA